MRKFNKAHQAAFVAAILVILTFAAYRQVLENKFVKYDDDVYVYENKNIQHGITLESLRWAFNVGYASNWHPLTWVSHMMDYRLFGAKPTGHHLINLLIHALNTVLLLLVFRRMTGSLWKSAFVAALFALHPMHVESVAWASERKDVLSTFFWLLTMGAYVLYSEKPGLKRYLTVVVLYALGLLAKPMLVTLPLALLLLDYWPLQRLKSGKKNQVFVRGRIWEKLPLLALAMGSSVITLIAQNRGESLADLQALPLGVRIANALVSYVSYVDKMIWPTKLAILYPHPKDSLPLWKIGVSLALLNGFSVLIFKASRKRPYLGFGWLWYLITLLPVIGVLHVGLQSMADRYTYIPFIGLFMIIAWGIPDALEKWGKGRQGERDKPGRKAPVILVVCACLIIAVLAAGTWVQTGYWHDSRALFQHAIDVTDGNFLAHLNLGWVFSEQGKVDEAIEQYHKSIAIRSDWDIAYYNLGVELAKRGDAEEAIEAYKEALQLNPGMNMARVNLSGELMKAGRLEEAMQLGQGGSESAELRYNLGYALEEQGRYEEAAKEYQEAVRLKPDFGLAHNNLAVVSYYMGDYAKAWEEAHLAQGCGAAVHPGFLQALAERMPDPGG